MATEEHKRLAGFMKNVHSDLRQAAAKAGAENAWKDHCKKTSLLQEYAECMQKLATAYWEKNSSDSSKMANSRIDWVVNFCQNYFFTDLCKKYRIKEMEIAHKIDLPIQGKLKSVHQKIKLLDVGSCYNPFKAYDYLDVLALDLCPANENVFQCDFLDVAIGEQTLSTNNKIMELEKDSFNVVTFCFVLEYLPSSMQRIEACRRAYALLRTEGLLVIATPDSKHVGSNCRTMKCWRYTLARLGFSRIKYEKFPHMHCMAFRKSVHENIADRWATLHQESYMSFELNILQTIQNGNDEDTATEKHIFSEDSVAENFKELPELDH